MDQNVIKNVAVEAKRANVMKELNQIYGKRFAYKKVMELMMEKGMDMQTLMGFIKIEFEEDDKKFNEFAKEAAKLI